MPITYHVDKHDEGYAYRVGDVGQKVFRTMTPRWLLPGQLQSASKLAAIRQKLPSSSPTAPGKHRWLTAVIGQKLKWSTTVGDVIGR